MDENVWERGSVPLKLQLGDIVLGKVMLSLYRRSARLDESPLNVGEIPEPPPRLDGADGYVVWSKPIAKRLPVLGAHRTVIIYAPRQYRRFSIDLSGDFKRYFATLSSNTRSGLKRKLRKFAEASGAAIDWKEYRAPEQMAEFFLLASKVSAKSYQERLLGAGLPTDEAFITSAQASASKDGVRAYLLFFQGQPISYLYCPVHEGVVLYDHLGYDPAYSSLSPGTVLQMLALEALFAEQRFTIFDFTEGEGQHKQIFSTASCFCGDVYVISRRLIPVSLVTLHYAVDRTSAIAGMILNRVNLKSRFRQLIRTC